MQRWNLNDVQRGLSVRVSQPLNPRTKVGKIQRGSSFATPPDLFLLRFLFELANLGENLLVFWETGLNQANHSLFVNQEGDSALSI